MKLLYCFVLPVIFCCTNALAQDLPQNRREGRDSLRILKVFRESGLIMGYNFNYSKPNQGNFHIGEMGFWNSRFRTGRYPLSRTYYIATEVALFPPQKLIGPKFGGFIGFGPLVTGAEAVYYTNFEKGAFRFVPYFGIGNYLGKLTYHYHLRLSNTDFEPIDRMHINLTVQIFRLKNRQIK